MKKMGKSIYRKNIYFLLFISAIVYIGMQVYIVISVRSSDIGTINTKETSLREWRKHYISPTFTIPWNAEYILNSNVATHLFGKKRKQRAFLTIGIRSALAWQNDIGLLNATLLSVLKYYDVHPQNIFPVDCIIVVYFNDLDTSKNIADARSLYRVFKTFCDEGRLQMIHLPASMANDLGFNQGAINFNSTSKNLSALGAKENVDKAVLFLASKDLSDYYIELMIGSICEKDFPVKIWTSVHEYNRTWSMIKFGMEDSWGVLFRSKDLKNLARMMLKSVDTIPSKYYLQNFGDTISYKGDPLFVKNVTLKDIMNKTAHDLISELVRGSNPPAYLYTDMPTFEDYEIQYAYDRDVVTYFWTDVIDIDSYFTVKFGSPQDIARVIVTTGNYLNRDRLRFGYLKFGHNFDEDTKECFDVRYHWKFTQGFVDTLYQGDNNKLNGVVCIFIQIKSRQRDWLIIRDIFVVPKSYSTISFN